MFGGGGGAGCKRGMSPLPSLHLLLYSLKLWHVRWTGRDGTEAATTRTCFPSMEGEGSRLLFLYFLFFPRRLSDSSPSWANETSPEMSAHIWSWTTNHKK